LASSGGRGDEAHREKLDAAKKELSRMKTIEYVYKDAAGAVLGTITRIVDDVDGSKTFRATKGFPDPRPLYGLDILANRTAAPVLVVEGEKTAEAAGELFPSYVVTTSPFGAKAAKRADWSSLNGAGVTIWPDNDAEGQAYAVDVARLVAGAKIVSVPDAFPAKWDLADALPAGVTVEALFGLIQMAEAPKAEAPKAKAKKKPSKADLPKSVDEVKRARDAAIATILKLVAMTVENGCTEPEAEAAFNKAKELMEEHDITEADLKPEPTLDDFDDVSAKIDGNKVLNDVHDFYGRFISYPSQEAQDAHTLWTGHTHMMDIWDSTPRLSFMSPQPESGKTRASCQGRFTRSITASLI
jgi:DNA primase